MATKPTAKHLHTTIRLTPEVAEELSRGGFGNVSRSELINQCTLEGLRMRAHPGICFRGGPAGRRPGLHGGPDVWEVARLLGSVKQRGEEAIASAMELMDLTRIQVESVISYYVAYKQEIDQWISDLDAEADRLYAESLEREALLS